MKIAYFDCFSGASGDMILGALIDAGMPLAHLKRRLKLVRIGEYSLKLKRGGDFAGANLEVRTKREPRYSDYGSLDKAIARSGLGKAEKDVARAILKRLAEAEARVHGRSVDEIHFHEVGAADSLIDIVGAAVGVAFFGFDEIHSSPLPISRGRVRCRHGVLPVPAPATLELLKGVPLEATDVKGEMVTPTGAAILTEICGSFGSSPLQRIDAAGAGFGDREIPGRPNMLRLLIGEGFRSAVVETDIDDMDPQLFDPLMEALFDAGAADVSLAPIQMKKNRPATRVRVVAPWGLKDRMADILLSETTTFGVRYWSAEREMLAREFAKGKLKRGSVNFKIGRDAKGRIVKAVPEFEDVKKLARKTRRPLPEIYNEALAASLKLKR